MLDSGTTGHFIAVNAKVKNVRLTNNPLNIIIPDGNTMTSTHVCNIDWPSLPKCATEAHIIPQLKNQSLLSVVKLCDAGCDITFLGNECTIQYNGKTVLEGIKCPRTNLWLVPLDELNIERNIKNTIPQQTCNNTYMHTTQTETIKYLHQCFFSPTKTTLLRAIANNQLIGVPVLTK